VKLEELDVQIQSIKDNILKEFPMEPSYNNKGVVIEDLLSHPQPSEISVTAPKGIRNKGCGKRKRFVGAAEKAKKIKKKNKRKCNFCKKFVRGHDSRNCPVKLGKADAETKETTDEESDETYDEETDEETDEDYEE